MPFLIDDNESAEHYPCFVDLINNEKLRAKYSDKMTNYFIAEKKDESICLNCEWLFESNQDKIKH